MIRFIYICILFILIISCSFFNEEETGKPENLTVTINSEDNKMSLNWSPIPNCISYSIQEEIEDIGWINLAVNIKETSYTVDINNLEGSNNHVYIKKFRVKAIFNGSTSSEWSDVCVGEIIFDIENIFESYERYFEAEIIDLGNNQYQFVFYFKNNSNVSIDKTTVIWEAGIRHENGLYSDSYDGILIDITTYEFTIKPGSTYSFSSLVYTYDGTITGIDIDSIFLDLF